MPEAVLNKIKYLCKLIPKDEWSGPLFYTVEGSIKDPENMVITLQDILPLDKGTSAFTKYSFDGRFVDFIMEDGYPERFDWHIGHIHSHNVMSVFFSGTDREELHDNAPNHNLYLSLIINNYMDFIAKVVTIGSIKGETQTYPIMAQDEDGVHYQIGETSYDVNDEKLYIYDCEIDSPVTTIDTDDWFKTQVELIMKPKAPETPAYQQKPFTPAVQAPAKVIKDRREAAKEFATQIDFDKWEQEDQESEDQLDKYNQAVESFTKSLFKLSSEVLKEDTLESVMDDLNETEMTPQEIATNILEIYPALYDKYWPEDDDTEFIAGTWDVIDLLRDYEESYTFVDSTIKALEKFIENFKKEI